LRILNILRERGVEPEIFDPYALEQSTCESLQDILSKIDVAIVCTDHDEFLRTRSFRFRRCGSDDRD